MKFIYSMTILPQTSLCLEQKSAFRAESCAWKCLYTEKWTIDSACNL